MGFYPQSLQWLFASLRAEAKFYYVVCNALHNLIYSPTFLLLVQSSTLTFPFFESTRNALILGPFCFPFPLCMVSSPSPHQPQVLPCNFLKVSDFPSAPFTKWHPSYYSSPLPGIIVICGIYPLRT